MLAVHGRIGAGRPQIDGSGRGSGSGKDAQRWWGPQLPRAGKCSLLCVESLRSEWLTFCAAAAVCCLLRFSFLLDLAYGSVPSKRPSLQARGWPPTDWHHIKQKETQSTPLARSSRIDAFPFSPDSLALPLPTLARALQSHPWWRRESHTRVSASLPSPSCLYVCMSVCRSVCM